MRKTILFIALAFIVTNFSYAQEKAFALNSFWDNWFIQGQLGASYTFSENHRKAGFGDVIAPHAAISIGKHFSPTTSARFQISGWESKNYFEYVLNKKRVESTYKLNYLQANLDGLLNFTNLFMSYNPERKFNLSGIAGIGYAYGFKKDNIKGLGDVPKSNSFVTRVGLQADYRINDAVSLNLEVIGDVYPDNFNGIRGEKKYEGILNTMVGITYNLTKGGFKMVDTVDPAAIKAINDRINELKGQVSNKDAEISRLQRELKAKPEPQVVVEKTEVKAGTEVLMNAVVVFHIGSAKLEKNQDINIYNAARYLKDNPNVNVIVTGYADKSTGTAAINQRLSEQRAEAVSKVLIEQHGISKSRITTKASGDREQLFPTDQWNRVVVFTAVTK